MAQIHRNDVGSLVFDRSGGGNFRLWSAFSGAAFRRKLLDSMLCGVPRHHYDDDAGVVESPVEKPNQKERQNRSDSKRNGGSESLSELMNLTEASETGVYETEVERRRKIEAFEELQRVVKKLQLEEGSVQMEAAMDVRRLAKEDSEARSTLAMLGAIPPLVEMLNSNDQDFQIASLYALLNLGIGNDTNKAAIVKAGAVHKMLKLIECPDESPNLPVSEAIVANFLGLSALDSNKPIIGSSGAIPFLVKTLQNVHRNSSAQARQDSLRALYNLSISNLNISQIVETDFVPYLLSMVDDMEMSERILSILSNIVSTPEGRKAISTSRDAFPILIDVLSWTDSPGCQEKASYILMVMAHKAYRDRQAMIEAGIGSSLLELTLLGSTLAQKRASRILECLRVDKGKQVSGVYGGIRGAVVSAPICGSSSNGESKEGLTEEDDEMMSEEKKAVKQLVQQSLQNNMRRIVKRANLPQDFVPSDHFKTLTSTSTSKSLPF
ncbi:U-box domain-containing protein 12-like [Macadamia integrifolia]|uniref:U-box domain-containing protein 12-like n=1 Tax=Macadamia integrifolia TaxID=60698 RepID=UPI001C4F45EE|nr:U-box domain-containing protein 12-like [Macadamia integrifolia]